MAPSEEHDGKAKTAPRVNTTMLGELTVTLARFSMDLVRLVWSYVPPTATLGTQPHLLTTIGRKGAKDGQILSFDCRVAVNEGRLWVTDGDRVHVFNADDGRFLFRAGAGLAQFRRSTGLGFAANGNAYIADDKANRIVVCDRDGVFIREFGKPGREITQFDGAVDVAVHKALGFVVVADANNHRCQVFELDGRFITAFGGYGRPDGLFVQMHAVAVNFHGEIAVTEGTCRVQVCSAAAMLGFLAAVFAVNAFLVVGLQQKRRVAARIRELRP